ncbi:MAG: hypothetical protein IJ088_11320 [Clostridia bacterium]|nr:hypothetical protein [Clostridia bacterium]
MKKLLSCLLAIMMLLSVAGAFADEDRYEQSNVLIKFLNETDLKTKDLALQAQSGDKTDDLVIRIDGDNLHLVTRDNGTESGHVQLNPTGLYMKSGDSVTLLRYATVTSVMQEIVKSVDAMIEETIKNLPEEKEEALTEKELKELKAAVTKLGILASAVAAQERADAVTLGSAAVSFANKFKPEYVLDVKNDDGSVEVSLRSEAFATALAEALDELMSNPAMAELVDRHAALTGGMTFAQAQKEWLLNREATLDAIRTIKTTGKVEENGHITSHFQIGEETAETKVLVYDTDSWVDAEDGEANLTATLGFKDEDPLVVYEFAVAPDYYREKLTAGDSVADVRFNLENGQITSGKVVSVMDDKEELEAEFGPDYLYVKTPEGGISTSVRETWTGKLRYEFVAETAEGEESSIVVDYYEDDDSLVCELNTSESEDSALFKLSRIDKINVDDLSASKNINEITADMIKNELVSLLKMVVSATSAVEAPAK